MVRGKKGVPLGEKGEKALAEKALASAKSKEQRAKGFKRLSLGLGFQRA
jgi:hypothetical protein